MSVINLMPLANFDARFAKNRRDAGVGKDALADGLPEKVNRAEILKQKVAHRK